MGEIKSFRANDFVEMNFDMGIHNYLYDKDSQDKRRVFDSSNPYLNFRSESEQFKTQAIIDWRASYREPLKLTFDNYGEGYFAMYFELGDGFYMHSDINKNFIKSNSIYMVFCRDFSNENYGLMLKNSLQHSFVVIYSIEELRKLAEKYPEILENPYRRFEKGESFFLQGKQHILTAEMRLIISQIKQAQLLGNVREPYIEAKTMELLALQFSHLITPKTKYCKRKSDKNKIYEAQEILLSDIHQLPTIPELAKQVGVNEMKLKQGFKEIFGQSIHQYVVNYRLTLAREILLDSDKSIAEVAFECGYSYPSHFCTAFKRHFGVPPSKIRT